MHDLYKKYEQHVKEPQEAGGYGCHATPASGSPLQD